MSAVDPQAQQAGAVISDVEQAVEVVVKESKAGYKTTEFWLTAITSVLVALSALPVPHNAQGYVVGAIVALYALARGLAKLGTPSVQPPA